MTNIPYTYLIGWADHNIYYYGVRYAKNCNPTDLWKTYFTSSSHVKNFREKNGEPDIIQIRKIFTCKNSAINWENRVLTKLNIFKNKIWLNKTNNKAIWYIRTDEIKNKFSKKMKGRCSPFKGKLHSEESKILMSNSHKGIGIGKKRNFSETHITNIKLSRAGQPGHKHTEDEKLNLSLKAKEQNFGKINNGKIWLTDGNHNIRVYPDDIKNHIGYTRGRSKKSK